MYADDQAIVGGVARLAGTPVMLIGHQKGRDTEERVRRNYGMPKPEGYRKALRLMKMAELVAADRHAHRHAGAYPGSAPRSAPERGDARNLLRCRRCACP